MNKCVIYSSLKYFHNHTQDGKHPPQNSGYDGIVGRNAGFGQMNLNVFDIFDLEMSVEHSFFESFAMPENLVLDFVYCNDKVFMTIGTDLVYQLGRD